VRGLLASEGDGGHQGGLRFLARELAPRELWVGARSEEQQRLAALADEVRAGGGTVHPLAAGDVALDAHGVRIECLHPPAGEALSANDSSLVLRLRFREHVMLFPGDVELPAEGPVLARFPPVGWR